MTASTRIPRPTDEPLHDALELIELAGFSADIEHARQIYVNRDLRMSQIGWVGFDMDYTLALYHQIELDALSVKHTVDSLVDKFGYPESIRTIEPDPHFAIRGLVIDRKLGNILKLDSHYYVGRVYHGLKPVERAIKRAYQDEPVRLSLDRYVLVDTLFSLPETFLYGALIEHLEATGAPSQTLDYERLYDDVRAAIDMAHADGRIKREMLADMPRYVRRDPELAAALHKLRSAGKRLFLLTNSEWYYTREVMSYLLDGQNDSYPTWSRFFDVVITTARKPLFFKEAEPFVELDSAGVPSEHRVTGLQRGAVYAGGNIQDFERFLSIRGSEVLYVGDHIYGDIVRSKRDSAWRTAMVIQEMEPELVKQEIMKKELAEWAELDERVASLNSDLSAHRSVLERLDEVYDQVGGAPANEKVGRARRELKKSLEQLTRRRREDLRRLIDLDGELSRHFNPYWGLLFKEGGEHSVFGGQVENYACVYTSRASNFRLYSPMRYFRARQQWMPHEM